MLRFSRTPGAVARQFRRHDSLISRSIILPPKSTDRIESEPMSKPAMGKRTGSSGVARRPPRRAAAGSGRGWGARSRPVVALERPRPGGPRRGRAARAAAPSSKARAQPGVAVSPRRQAAKAWPQVVDDVAAGQDQHPLVAQRAQRPADGRCSAGGSRPSMLSCTTGTSAAGQEVARARSRCRGRAPSRRSATARRRRPARPPAAPAPGRPAPGTGSGRARRGSRRSRGWSSGAACAVT